VHISTIFRQFWYDHLALKLLTSWQFGCARRRATCSSFSRLGVTRSRSSVAATSALLSGFGCRSLSIWI